MNDMTPPPSPSPRPFRERVDEPSAWTAEELRRDGSWIYELTRAVRADHRDELALAHLEADRLHRAHPAIGDPEVGDLQQRGGGGNGGRVHVCSSVGAALAPK